MAIKKEIKKQLISRYQKHPKDAGSAGVQIAIFTKRINEITRHLASHPKDKSSRLGLIKLVAKRKKLLAYLKRVEPQSFEKITNELQIRA
ncbi:MAG: 30S ribosomal protein S15 [Elusimicrobia bacterium]|nr:30S ribosomal protein S15 [Elusimicrobiota bacterium]